MAAIMGIFFLIGIAVGIVGVIAMAAVRAERRGGPGTPPGHGPGRPDEEPPDSGREGSAPDGGPRWPDGTRSWFAGR